MAFEMIHITHQLIQQALLRHQLIRQAMLRLQAMDMLQSILLQDIEWNILVLLRFIQPEGFILK